MRKDGKLTRAYLDTLTPAELIQLAMNPSTPIQVIEEELENHPIREVRAAALARISQETTPAGRTDTREIKD